MQCVITPVAWDGIIPSLTSGQIDAIMASMSITEERLQTIDFSDKYYNTPTVIVGAKGVEMAPTPEGLAGKIIGVQASTVHAAYVEKYFAPRRPRSRSTRPRTRRTRTWLQAGSTRRRPTASRWMRSWRPRRALPAAI
jgi:membrane-bound lytic murein transglycosylase MltF